MRRSLTVLRHTLFAALVAACAGLAFLIVQAWRGALVDDPPRRPAAAAAGSLDAGGTAGASTAAPPAADGAPGAPSPAGGSVRTPASRGTTVALTATKGPCWLVARAGSATGKVLYEGLLEQGQRLTFSRERVWLRLGAAQNVRLVLNGEPAARVPGGTVDLVATRSGVEPARSGA